MSDHPESRPTVPLRIIFLQFLALTGFAVAQPLLQLIQQNPDFLSVHHTRPADLLVMLATLFLALPVVLGLLVFLAGLLGPGIRRMVQSWIMGLLLGLILLPVIDNIPGLGGLLTLVVAGIGAGVFAYFYHDSAFLQRNLTYLVIGVPIFLGMFLVSSGVKSVFNTSVEIVQTEGPVSEVPVVMVILDELPTTSLMNSNLQVDADLFPNFARLAGQSTWYRNATTVSSATLRSVPAILSGRLPRWDETPTLHDHPRNLFTLLGGSHAVLADEAQTHLCPEGLKPGYSSAFLPRIKLLFSDLSVLYQHLVIPDQWTADLDPVSNKWIDFKGQVAGNPDGRPVTKIDRFQTFLSLLEMGAKPPLAVTHALLPHNPYRFFPDGTIYTWRRKVPLQEDGCWGDDALVRVHSYRRHLLQLTAVDRLIGDLLDKLDDLGILDQSLIVVTADHGASWQEGQSHRKFSTENALDIMSVPLFFKAPGQTEGHIDDRNAQTIDIMPTVVGALNLDPGWDFDGVDLLAGAAQPRAELDFMDPDSRQHHKIAPARIAERNQIIIWKEELFGSLGGQERLFAQGNNADLLGRQVDEFRVTTHPSLKTKILDAEKLAKVKHGELFLPAEINGILAGSQSQQRLPLALAVNGTLAGVSKTYLPENQPDHRPWQVFVPQGALRDGHNEIDLFLVQAKPSGTTLAQIPMTGTSLLGVDFGGKAVLGVKDDGFYSSHDWKGNTTRWTNGRARLEIPLLKGERPELLVIKLMSTGPEGTHLNIRVNENQILDKDLPRGQWEGRFPLKELELGEIITVLLESDSFVPAELSEDSKDNRPLGVAVTSLWVE